MIHDTTALFKSDNKKILNDHYFLFHIFYVIFGTCGIKKSSKSFNEINNLNIAIENNDNVKRIKKYMEEV